MSKDKECTICKWKDGKYTAGDFDITKSINLIIDQAKLELWGDIKIYNSSADCDLIILKKSIIEKIKKLHKLTPIKTRKEFDDLVNSFSGGGGDE